MASSSPSPPALPAMPDIAAFELLDVPVVLADPQGRLLAANAAFTRFTLWEPAQVQGRRIDELLFGPATDPTQRLWIPKRLRTGEGFAPVDFTGQDARGQPLHCRLGVRMVEGGAVFTLQPAAREHTLRTEANRCAELLALAQDLGHFGVWERNVQTMAGRWDPHVWRIWGLPAQADALPLHEAMAHVPAPEREAAVRAFTDSMRRCGSYSARYRVRRADGQMRHVRSHWEIRPGPDGLPERALGILLDETEPFQQSQREAELTHRLEMATSTAGVAVWSLDAATGRLHWDRQMHLLHGGTDSAVPDTLDAYITRCIHPADRAAAKEAWNALQSRRSGLVELDLRVVHPDGSVRRVASRTSAETGPLGTSLYGVMLDVTERHAAQARLREATERIALVSRAVGIGTWQAEGESTMVWWDEQMHRLRGLPPQEGATTLEQRMACIHPADRDAVYAEMRAAMAEGRPTSLAFRVVWPDGTVRWIASRSTPMRDETGRLALRIGINWDITDARAAAEADQQRQLALRESQAKSQFLARMSHELRTPLNAVLGFAQLLLTEREPREPALERRRVEHIRTAGEHLLSLINDVLDLSSLESGELPLQLAPVPLGPLLGSVLPLVENLARQQQVSVRLGALELAMRGDAMRLRQVLINLLSNAIKYNRPGGQVEVDAEARGDEVLLRVRDTGRGMTAEQLAHVFEPFNRLGADKAGIEGTGIGLAIVHASMQRMGGRVAVTSTLDVGSTFELCLPRAEPLEPPPQESGFVPLAPSMPARAAVHRVLYIEDNPVNQLIVSELVRRRADLQCDTAPDGHSGIEQALATRPSLILVDMQLPDFDGHEVLRRLRADPATADIRCVALSANAMPDDIRRALDAGFDDYWTKPLEFKRFNAALESLFGPAP